MTQARARTPSHTQQVLLLRDPSLQDARQTIISDFALAYYQPKTVLDEEACHSMSQLLLDEEACQYMSLLPTTVGLMLNGKRIEHVRIMAFATGHYQV